MRTKAIPGGYRLWLSARDTYDWAHRPGAAWPCSTISGHRLFAEVAANGDLVDYALDGKSGDDDDIVNGYEFTAIVDDFLAKSPIRRIQ